MRRLVVDLSRRSMVAAVLGNEITDPVSEVQGSYTACALTSYISSIYLATLEHPLLIMQSGQLFLTWAASS